jgi:hypothetical protein
MSDQSIKYILFNKYQVLKITIPETTNDLLNIIIPGGTSLSTHPRAFLQRHQLSSPKRFIMNKTRRFNQVMHMRSRQKVSQSYKIRMSWIFNYEIKNFLKYTVYNTET